MCVGIYKLGGERRTIFSHPPVSGKNARKVETSVSKEIAEVVQLANRTELRLTARATLAKSNADVLLTGRTLRMGRKKVLRLTLFSRDKRIDRFTLALTRKYALTSLSRKRIRLRVQDAREAHRVAILKSAQTPPVASVQSSPEQWTPDSLTLPLETSEPISEKNYKKNSNAPLPPAERRPALCGDKKKSKSTVG